VLLAATSLARRPHRAGKGHARRPTNPQFTKTKPNFATVGGNKRWHLRVSTPVVAARAFWGVAALRTLVKGKGAPSGPAGLDGRMWAERNQSAMAGFYGATQPRDENDPEPRCSVSSFSQN
jgi:hypothetical protein